MKIAYLCEPQLGGTYSFYLQLRPALARHGIAFNCVPPIPAAAVRASRFRDDPGLDLLDMPADLPGATAALITHFQTHGYDGVLTLPCCGALSANVPRYLPIRLRSFLRVPMMTRGAYAPTQAVAPWTDSIVAVSDRVADDLVGEYRLPRDQVATVFNGVCVDSCGCPPRVGAVSPGPVRVLYAGRLSDLDKGVLLLPRAWAAVAAVAPGARLLLAGEGPDRHSMESAFAAAGVSGPVSWLGGLPYGEVQRLLREVDVFVLPSRFEGCPNALMEAMAAGCACVAAGIKGSVDRIVRDGVDGLLFTPGDAADLGRKLAQIVSDAALRSRLGPSAQARIASTFNFEQCAAGYARVFTRAARAGRRDPLPLSAYKVPRAMQPTWRTLVPAPVKNYLRRCLERHGRSV